MTSLGGYLDGWAVLFALVGGCGWWAVEARRWLLAGWRGASARLAEVVLGAAAVLVAVEIVGSFGAFTRLGLVAGGAVGAAAAALTRRLPRRPSAPSPRVASVDGWACAGAAVVVTAVAAQWVAWTIQAYRQGMTAYDALFYHSPIAARFAQVHSVTHLQSIVPGEAVTFFPATTELWHAVGMVAFHGDLASPALNLIALAVALLAAWCVGQGVSSPGSHRARRGTGPLAVAGVATILTVPYMAVSQPGSSFNDAAALAAVLAAIALLARAGDDPGAGLVGAIAAGLAISIKLSFVAPALAVVLGAAWLLPRRRRLSAVMGWLAVTAIVGGYWYARNLIRVGNPVPGLNLGLPTAALPVDARYGARLLTSLDLSAHGWHSVYGPGLRDYFGGAWWAGVAVVLAAVVLAATAERWHRIMAAVITCAVVAYTVTPVSGDPTFFRFNLRYTLALQGIAVLALATHPWLRGRWAQRSAFAVAAVVMLMAWPAPAPGGDPFRFGAWPAGSSHRLAAIAVTAAMVALVAALVVAVAVFGASVRRRPQVWAVAAALGVVAVVVAGRGVADRYAAARFRHLPGELGPSWAWAQTVSRARIGVVGLYQQYPYAGARLDNFVQYVGVATAHGGLARAPSCAAWRTAVDAGRYDYIVTSREGIFPPPGEPREAAWTRADPSAHEILHTGDTAVFRLSGPLDPARCS